MRRAGHEPVARGELVNGELPDLVIVEPASPDDLGAAVGLRERQRSLPIIFTSILPPSRETRALDPFAYLMKPFRLRELERAIAAALVIF